MIIPQRKAFLQFVSNQNTWELSPPYAEAVKKHIGLDPTYFQLPWPIDLIPPRSSKFYCAALPDDFHGTAGNWEYTYTPDKRLVTIEIKIDSGGIDWYDVDDHYITILAEQGLLFDSGNSIAGALVSAGLPATIQGLEKKLAIKQA